MNDMLSAAAPALDNPFGALVTIFLIALGQSFRKQSETAEEVNIGVWVYALEQAFQELSEYANHRPAMAPTLDVLDQFIQTLHSTGDVLKAAKAAEKSIEPVTSTGAQLLCAFFAGLAGPLNGKVGQISAVEEAAEVVEEEREQGHSGKEVEAKAKDSSTDARAAREPEIDQELKRLYEDRRLRSARKSKGGATSSGIAAEADTEGRAGEGLQVEVLDQTLREESPPIQTSKKREQTEMLAEQKHKEVSEEATALGLTSKEVTLEEQAQPVLADDGQVTEASRDAIVDALQIKYSDFDAAMEGIRSREPIPLPTRQIEEMTLLDMVRQQIETLSASSKEGAAAEKDADEEEYELV